MGSGECDGCCALFINILEMFCLGITNGPSWRQYPFGAKLNPGSTGRLMDPGYRNPLSEQFNIGYQWALNNSSTLEVDYVHVLGLHENKTVNINPTDPNNGFARPLDDDFAAAGVPVLGSVRVEESVNRSRYDGVNFSFRQRLFFLSL